MNSVEFIVNQWKLVFRNGHKYFRWPDGRVALADNSGRYPHQTDDGVLWLDTSRDITLHHAEAASATIPLLDNEGEPTQTGACMCEALQVAAEFGMIIRNINSHGKWKVAKV